MSFKTFIYYSRLVVKILIITRFITHLTSWLLGLLLCFYLNYYKVYYSVNILIITRFITQLKSWLLQGYPNEWDFNEDLKLFGLNYLKFELGFLNDAIKYYIFNENSFTIESWWESSLYK